jgi:alpha-D-ribose 1-methylphosphonate 5-triphosphate synthase subunit PhnH
MTKVHDREGLIAEADRRLLGADFSGLEEAQFVVVSGAVAPGKDWEPSVGTLTSPEQGATILLTCESVESGDLSISLTGPGVPGELNHQVSGLDPAWLERREGWVSEFPKGVDLILVGRDGVVAWPRTTNIQVR